jgi:hypothetical protein
MGKLCTHFAILLSGILASLADFAVQMHPKRKLTVEYSNSHFKGTVSRDGYLFWKGLNIEVVVSVKRRENRERSIQSLLKGTVPRDGYLISRSKHFNKSFLFMRWWFSRSFKSFSPPYRIINCICSFLDHWYCHTTSYPGSLKAENVPFLSWWPIKC